MKKVFYLALLFYAIQIQGQKSVKISNLTANTVTIQDLVTRTDAFALPEFHSKPSQNITIPPYGTYILINTANATRFPFSSPTSVPQISKWERFNANGTTTANIVSNAAWLTGANQVFYWVQLGIGVTSKQIGVNNTSQTSNGWSASYSQISLGGTSIQYTIVIQ